MICFQIEINGQKVCTAGVGDTGSLGVHLNWLKPNPVDALQRGTEQMVLGVSGFTQPPGEIEWVRARWLDRAMKAGDQIVIRILEQDKADAPAVQGKVDNLLRPDPRQLLGQVQKAYADIREEIEKKSHDNYSI
jgi:hypothetical protein